MFIENIRQTVEEFKLKAFSLRKQNKVPFIPTRSDYVFLSQSYGRFTPKNDYLNCKERNNQVKVSLIYYIFLFEHEITGAHCVNLEDLSCSPPGRLLIYIVQTFCGSKHRNVGESMYVTVHTHACAPSGKGS